MLRDLPGRTLARRPGVGRWAADGQRAFNVRSACASFLGSSHEDPRATTLEPVGNLTAALCRLDIPKAADLSGWPAGAPDGTFASAAGD